HEVTQLDLLLGYVAYYVSRGRAIISPVRGPILFDQTVYQYWGYTSAFLYFWRGLQQQRDFDEFYLEGDIATFGEFLHKGRTVQECVRCRLPVPSVDQGVYNSGCPCDQRFFREQSLPHPMPQTIEAERKITHVVVIGSLPSDAEILKSWFRDNELDVTFVAKLEPMPEQITAQAIDLILIDADVTEAQANQWVQKLRGRLELQTVPIVALSPQNIASLPWTEREMGIDDYLVTPLGGDRLAEYLRQASLDRATEPALNLHWFPR
ncbi:MAG: hypothetical protein WCA35_22665, partial [Kovacikia sp.]